MRKELSETERSDLVAFLDGELADDDAQTIEMKVEGNRRLRREVESLEKTWRLLDSLPQLKASRMFASDTLTRVRTHELQLRLSDSRRRRRLAVAAKLVAWAACVVVVFALGFVLAQARARARDAKRDSELSAMLTQLDALRAVPSIAFLRDLDETNVLDTVDAYGPSQGAKQTGGTASENLREKRQQFESLARAEQHRIRQIGTALQRQPQKVRSRLITTMLKYQRWKQQLPLHLRENLDRVSRQRPPRAGETHPHEGTRIEIETAALDRRTCGTGQASADSPAGLTRGA